MLLAEVKRNLVAIISLCVALSGLGYNTWRNETTESHRNVRQASFALLEQLGQLQQLVYQRYYAHQRDDVTRITCWGKVMLVRDMGPLVSGEVAARSNGLFETWSDKLDDLDEGDAGAEKAISGSIAALREQLLVELKRLR
jgi:hypothetical protein